MKCKDCDSGCYCFINAPCGHCESHGYCIKCDRYTCELDEEGICPTCLKYAEEEEDV